MMKAISYQFMDSRLGGTLSRMMLWALVLAVMIGTTACKHDFNPFDNPPVITLNGSAEMTVLLNSTFVDPGATAMDEEDGPVDVTVTGSVDTGQVGEYTLTYTAEDSDGNSASATRKVTVVASEDNSPVITLHGSAEMTVLLNSTFVDPGATAMDAEDGPVDVTVTGTVDTGQAGEYTLTYTAEDSDGNSASATRKVTVVASEDNPPVITLNGSAEMTVALGSTFVDPGATAEDPEDGPVDVTVTGTVDTGQAGEYTLTYTAEDSDGNSASATRKVTVVENEDNPPVITLHGSAEMTVLLDGTFVDPGATAEDPEDGPVDVTVTGTVDTGQVGEYTLTYTAEDSDGNSASATRKVTVVEKEVNKASLGMGLNGIFDYSTALPFIDLMKQAREWQDWDNGVEGFDLDANDWVHSLKEGQTAGTVFLTLEAEEMPFDQATVLYEGEGALEYAWSCHLVEHLDDGKDRVSVGSGPNLLKITATNPDNPIRNIRIIPEPYMDAYAQGQIFNPDWLALVDRFRAVRFMDWMKTNGSEQSSWQNRPLPEHRTWRIHGGVPLEIMIQLANLIHADPWFNIPHMADTDYMEHFAQMVKDQLNPDLTVYVEHSNEVWNWGFAQAHYAEAAALDRWGIEGDGFIQWHGMRTAMVCDAFKQGAFADETDRVKCVLGVQTAWHGLEDGALNCPAYVDESEGNEPCYRHGIDYVGVTTYFHGGLTGPRGWDSQEQQQLHEDTMRSWFTEADGGLDKAFEQLNTGSLLTDIDKFHDFTGIVDELHGQLDYWSGIGNQYGLGIVAYEGGQHITANGLTMEGDEAFVAFHLAVNRDPRMKQLYTDLFNTFKTYGGQLHMNYYEMGRHSMYGSWGVLEHHNQETSPRWEAIDDFNSSVECWWDGCAD